MSHTLFIHSVHHNTLYHPIWGQYAATTQADTCRGFICFPAETCQPVSYPCRRVAGARVTKSFSGIGKSITAAGLRGVEGLYLVGIDRETGEELRVVDPDTTIQASILNFPA